MPNNLNVSQIISTFLNFIAEANTQYGMASQNLEEVNLELQDLQHYIEFGAPSGVSMVKIYTIYRQTRQARRFDKNTMELYLPILEWMERNSKAVRDLQETLGLVRKIEERQNGRSYLIRTHILDDITTDIRLKSKEEVNDENGIG